MSKWHSRFFSLAQTVSDWSKDPNKKVGAVIVRPDKTISSVGYNGFPRGIRDSPELLNNKELKNQLIIHAEANALLNSKDESNVGHTLYCTSFCCCNCAGLLIQKGIKHIVVPELDPHSSWYTNFLSSRNVLHEVGVRIDYINPVTYQLQ